MKRHGKIIVIFLVLIAFMIATAAQVSGAPTEKTRVWVEYAPGKAAAVSGSLRQMGAQFHYHFGELDSFVVTVSSSAMKGLINNPNVTYVEVDPERLRPEKSEVQRLLADNKLAHQHLGWKPQVELTDGLKKTIVWIRDHIDHYQPGRYQV